MEEDIKRLEYILEFSKKLGITYALETQDEEAIKHLISAYKKLEEENKELNIQFKELDKECSRLEKKEYDKEDKYLVRIKELEEENKEYKRINSIVDKISSKDIEKVIKEFNYNYIPKQAIRDKIEELHNKIYEHQGKENLYGYDVHDYIEKFKEELLEERNK